MTAFHLKLHVDAHGVLMSRVSGTFDFDAWQDQLRILCAGPLAGVTLSDRPAVTDVCDCLAPSGDWYAQYAKVIHANKQSGIGQYRRALFAKASLEQNTVLNFFLKMERDFAPDAPPPARVRDPARGLCVGDGKLDAACRLNVLPFLP